MKFRQSPKRVYRLLRNIGLVDHPIQTHKGELYSLAFQFTNSEREPRQLHVRLFPLGNSSCKARAHTEPSIYDPFEHIETSVPNKHARAFENVSGIEISRANYGAGEKMLRRLVRDYRRRYRY